MRTSLTEIAEIDAHINGQPKPPEKLVFQARLLVNPRLRQDLVDQKLVYRLIKLFGRRQLKQQLQKFQQELLSRPDKRALQQELNKIFNP